MLGNETGRILNTALPRTSVVTLISMIVQRGSAPVDIEIVRGVFGSKLNAFTWKMLLKPAAPGFTAMFGSACATPPLINDAKVARSTAVMTMSRFMRDL